MDEETIRIEIRKRTVGLSSSYGEKIYDGTPLTVVGINEDGEGWIDADKGRVKYTMTGSQTDAGESDNTFDVEFPLGSEEYFKEHYAITISYATLNVAQRPVTLTSASGSKEYDGEPLTNHKVTVGEATWGTGWVDGQGATYSFTGSQKIVGSSENAFECIPNEGTNLDNYQINKTYGTLTVTDRSEKYQITLTPNSKSVTYDGTEKSVSGFEALEFQINGQTFYVSGVEASATGTDAGEYPVKVSGQAVVIDSDGNDVTDQFTVNIDDAKLTIVEGDSDKSASNLPHTGDSAALYAMGICGVAIAAGAGALFTSRKRNNYK
ncbi:LPXTG cell wall anchor domain-containing protein [Collinsella bouchesdurhonensis]|uniref:LPXTG cell wall anchor domain-containing protein n=1 Tax=Collinsella bouchesdurhonensis TaxID=1907654 RepID=UPI003F934067